MRSRSRATWAPGSPNRASGIKVPEWVARLPIAADAIQQWWRENLAEPQSARAWLQSLNADKIGELLTTFGGQLLHRSFMFFIALIALFAFLRNGDTLGQRVSKRGPHLRRSRRRAGGEDGRCDPRQRERHRHRGDRRRPADRHRVPRRRRSEPDPVHRPDRRLRDAAVRRLGGVHRRGADAGRRRQRLRRSRCSPGAPW